MIFENRNTFQTVTVGTVLLKTAVLYCMDRKVIFFLPFFCRNGSFVCDMSHVCQKKEEKKYFRKDVPSVNSEYQH